MSKRYSGKSFKDSSIMKKAKLSLKEKRKIKREKLKKNQSELFIIEFLFLNAENKVPSSKLSISPPTGKP